MTTYRRVKGSNLTPDEVDDNFEGHDDRITELEENPPVATGISNITVVGTQMTIYLADATELGPYTLPQANFRPSIVSEIEDDTYTPVLADGNGFKRCTNAAGCAVTFPADDDPDYPVDTEIAFYADTDGPVTFDSPTDVELRIPAGYLREIKGQGFGVAWKKVATGLWVAIGTLAEDVTA